MYLKPTNESIAFMIKNIRDVLFSTYERDSLLYSIEKMLKANKEFGRYHKLTKDMCDQIIKAINQYDTKSKVDSAIDVVELEKYWHRKLKAYLASGDRDVFESMPSASICAMIYRYYSYEYFDAYDSYSALLPIPPENRFIAVITFDENNIYRVDTFASPNFYDSRSPVYPVHLNIQL